MIQWKPNLKAFVGVHQYANNLLYTGWSKKVYESIYVEKKLWALKILKIACSKKVTRSKNRKIYYVLFLLQDNSYSSLVLKFQVSKLKIAIEVIKLSIWPQKSFFFKTLITSKLIDLAT